MSSTERHRGIQIHRGIIYGSHARLLTPEEKTTAPPEHTHKWTIFISSATSPPPDPGSSDEIDMDLIPGGNDDLQYLFKRVTFKLHDTYHNPNRIIEKPPFQVTETGWGEFTVNARINFVPESGEKPMNLPIPIKLFHRGQPVEPAPPAEPAPVESAQDEAEDVKPETEEKGETGQPVEDGDVSMADATPGAGPSTASADMTPLPVDSEGHSASASDAKAADTPGTANGTGNGDAAGTPAAGTVGGDGATADPAASTSALPAPPAPTPAQQAHSALMASKYPVHAWQYDELVFCDPYPAFYQLLTQNVPTPLPQKNRRARDLREEYDKRGGAADRAKKRKTGRASVGAGLGSARPGASREGTAAATDADGEEKEDKPVPPPTEDATADTPLEFSKEMERGEWNVLNDARVKVVEEMDRWRERLIAQEKDLFKMKEEMKSMS